MHLELLIINKLNLQLIRVLQYLLQFFLKIRHHINKFNVISDILSKLLRMQFSALQKKIKDKIFTHNVKIISMFISFKKKIVNTEILTNRKFSQS